MVHKFVFQILAEFAVQILVEVGDAKRGGVELDDSQFLARANRHNFLHRRKAWIAPIFGAKPTNSNLNWWVTRAG
jgi:hypothetical protein